MAIADNIKTIKNSIPEHVTLVAVSKTKPNSDILEAYECGHKIFGENKVQDLTRKYEELPKDIEWHFIGHLQSNKIKYIAPFVSLIHGVDSQKLLIAINKAGIKNNRKIKCLLQVHIAQESTKFGFSEDELIQMLNEDSIATLNNIEICGVMGMATNTPDTAAISKEFAGLKEIFTKLKEKYFSKHENFKHISMGMSGDYTIAIEQGSTMIRVGSSIFGQRNYH
ncbi:YggS family pyridoxal phosphate-dependent enzyme [Labilibacter sediminis]|nr:YggS family pyridoxal phosphate-dependent enzyme [Labilibacter sediminis]